MDATIVGVPRSTKNANNACYPQIHQIRKSQQRHFGMKLHIGVVSRTGPAHRGAMTTSNAHDKQVPEDLLHGDA
ncbi:transposase [Xanthomonas hydrangeae]|uniref:transposase n=1 Tax=Xanthomonas hydrangeae TaxID=2775159 RepID=UPI003CE53B2D